MIVRYAIAIAIGAAITLSLLFIMQFLIAVSGSALTDSGAFRIVDFVRVEREEIVDTRRDQPDRPPEPERPPEMPDTDMSDDFNTGLAVSIGGPSIGTDLGLGGLNFGVSDGEYLPIVRVAPQYPARAAQTGLEGWVLVEFVVTTQGTVRDAEVVESSNRIFERPAVDAAYRFRYRPRVIDGNPIEVPGVRNLFTFELDGN
jgi:periplasmic protein TonB